jgi:hypothetical protein
MDTPLRRAQHMMLRVKSWSSAADGCERDSGVDHPTQTPDGQARAVALHEEPISFFGNTATGCVKRSFSQRTVVSGPAHRRVPARSSALVVLGHAGRAVHIPNTEGESGGLEATPSKAASPMTAAIR